jgi:FkbM family methyltransferase
MQLQSLKSYIASLGPDSMLLRAALRAYGSMHGFAIHFSETGISLRKQDRDMLLSKAQYVQVPIMMECYELFFDTISSSKSNGDEILDFSKPALQTYKKNGLSFYFPAVPEDDVMDAYTFWYSPSRGDTVWDAGAYAGATTCFLSQMVGPSGKVYAFEPDESNYAYLMRNLELHEIHNVNPVHYALDASSGEAAFQVDGTMAAGIRDYLTYSGKGKAKTIPTLSLPDACAKLGHVPKYIKMDIEGAEVAVISGAADFLKGNGINFAIESYHRVDGEYTCKALERLFASIDYEVESSDRFGQMFTWARPK